MPSLTTDPITCPARQTSAVLALPSARFAPNAASAISAGQVAKYPGGDERGQQQRAGRLVLQVRHVRAGPGDQPGLRGRGQLGVGELDGEEAAQVRRGERVAVTHVLAGLLNGPG